MADNNLFLVSVAVLFGAVTTIIPSFANTLQLELIGVTLLQISSLAISAFAISSIFYSNTKGVGKLFSGGILIITGFLLVGTIGGADVIENQDKIYTIAENFSQNGTIGPNMEENDNAQLQFNDQFTGTAPTQGQYTSDIIHGEGSITFDEIVVEISDFDSDVHNASLTIETLEEGQSVSDETTYNLTGGTNYLNVSRVNSGLDTQSFSFDYDVTTQETNRETPRLDYFTFETTQEVQTETGDYGVVSILAGLIFILGGVGVLFS